MKRIRTFIAVDLAPHVAQRAGELVQQLQAELPQANIHWVAPDLMHITVKFVGEVDESELAQLCRGASRACAEQTSFELVCAGLGVFPRPDRPRTLWLGIQGPGRHTLQTVQANIESSLAAAGFPRELRRYEPHVTLGRVRGQQGWEAMPELLTRFQDDLAGAWVVEELVVYASRLARGGPTYMPLGKIPLL